MAVDQLNTTYELKQILSFSQILIFNIDHQSRDDLEGSTFFKNSSHLS